MRIQLVRAHVGSEFFANHYLIGAGWVYFGRFSGGSFFWARLFFGLWDVVGLPWGNMRCPLFSFLLVALIVFVGGWTCLDGFLVA